MSVIKCKMCGGDLELIEDSSVAVCEYCGTQQTVPAADNEKKLTLFARANRLRLACEFDKAAGVYESIVADFPTEAEAYWGLVLCSYGIEYVDDPATGKKIPTCHRSSFDSVMEDSDFEQVLENADAVARRVYRDEAKAIEELRRGIVEVSGREPPYDIFICYKETAEDGQRTVDSVIAQDVYDALTEKGYRVFFSRISLEDKLGTEYEPYIFSALHSAKIMLAFGTDYEYYNAVWVKNEWSRFLQLMTKDKSKHLIPCYKGIDAYDMPKGFAKLQAQDMGKVGAIQDLLRGIDKLIGKENAHISSATPHTVANVTVAALLERAQMLLEDREWESAVEYGNRILDIEPKSANAYIVLLLADYHVKSLDDLCIEEHELICSRNYQRAKQFAVGNLSVQLSSVEQRALEYTRQEENRRRELEKQSNLAKKQHRESMPKWVEAAKDLVQAGTYYTMGLKSDGTVLTCGRNTITQSPPVNLSAWKNIVAAEYNGFHAVGLCADGTVVACGNNMYGQCNVEAWHDITSVACGDFYTVGVQADGSVVACGANRFGECNVDTWQNITSVICLGSHTIGLRADGTVVACGSNRHGQCGVEKWHDIVAIAGCDGHTVGLQSSGSVVACGKNAKGQCNVNHWRGIATVMCSDEYTVGLQTDGAVVACGNNDDGQCAVDTWEDIIAVACGARHTVGLRTDGTVVACGCNDNGQCNVDTWKNVVAIACSGIHTVGLCSNGTVLACGANENDRCEVSNWRLFDKIDTYITMRAEQKDMMEKNRQQRMMMEKVNRSEELQKEEQALQVELSTLKGIFAGKRRKEILIRLSEIEDKMKELTK